MTTPPIPQPQPTPQPERVQRMLAATEGHTPGPWTAGGVPSWKYEHCCLEDQRNIYPPLGEAGPVAEVSGPENQALITAAPDLRALLAETAAALAAAEAREEALRAALGTVLDEAYDGQHSYRVDLSTLRAAHETLEATQ